MRSLLHSRFLVPLLLGPLLLLLAGVVAFSQQTDASRWGRHSVEVRLATRELSSTLLDAETGQRGYLATGEAVFLEPYEYATRAWRTELEQVRALTKHNPSQQTRVEELERLAEKQVELLAAGIESLRKGAARDELVEGMVRSKSVMDEARRVTAAIEREEAGLFLRRKHEGESRARWSVLLLCGGFATYVLVAAGALLLRRNAEHQRQRAAERAEHLRFSEEFIGILGHDLRSPLSTVMLAAQRAHERACGSDRKDLERILRSSQRMERMIGQLLDLARARLAGGIPITRTSANLCDVIEGVVDEVRAAHPDRAIAWSGSKDAVGEWDPDRVAQVVTNLVGNAIEHGDATWPVEVTLAAKGTELELRVRNLGPPIPPELQPHVFDPYRRGERTPGKGLGLGLFISKMIVVAHGGTIDVASTAEEGTTFVVRLPRRPPVAPSPCQRPLAPAPA